LCDMAGGARAVQTLVQQCQFFDRSVTDDL
jgi:hypothetical protein